MPTILLKNIPAYALKDRDTELGLMWPNEIDEFADAARELVGSPCGRGAMLFRVGNYLYVRGTKEYMTRMALFYDGWVAGRHPIKPCNQPIMNC